MAGGGSERSAIYFDRFSTVFWHFRPFFNSTRLSLVCCTGAREKSSAARLVLLERRGDRRRPAGCYTGEPF